MIFIFSHRLEGLMKTRQGEKVPERNEGPYFEQKTLDTEVFP